MPITTPIEIGSPNHKLLVDTAEIVRRFFSKYTTAAWLDTQPHDHNIIYLWIDVSNIRFWLEDNSKLIVYENNYGNRYTLDLPYTNNTLRGMMRWVAKYLVNYLTSKETQEKDTLISQDWRRCVTDLHRDNYDGYGYRFEVKIGEDLYSVKKYGDSLTFSCDNNGATKILQLVSGIKPDPSLIVLQKSEVLSTDGLMAKIDKWLRENV
jgi:hypothetical protein